ncbi:MAG TPA: hypothetical protein VNF07_03575 [Acidimicrobiales bacterium]|nr:hypothetical protein [Acidimicrobiales bacterium]
MNAEAPAPVAPEEGGRETPRTHEKLVLRCIGASLLVATGAIHLDLYVTGYRTIPTIGWLFLLQVIVAFGLGALVLGSRRALVSAVGAGFAVATLGGYLLSLRFGLFGFRELRTTAGIVAGVVEVAAFTALAAALLTPPLLRPPNRTALAGRHRTDRLLAAVPAARWAAGASSALAAALLGLSLAATRPGSTVHSSTALLKTANVHGVSVLTNSKGFTLYWFAPDTPSKSVCYGTCAAYWPPVTGKPIAGPGVTGVLGTIRRTDGASQVSFDHHLLYTYVGDSSPGEANGNNVNLNGGLWYEMAAHG